MKNPIVTRDVPAKDKNLKADFLNEAQRKELKKKLIEKYTKLIGLSNPKVVFDEVELFFAQNKQINQKVLSELETKIKKTLLKTKSKVTPNQNSASGNQEGKTVANSTQIIEENQQDNTCENLPSKVAPVIEDLENGEDWENLGMYQAYILRQEKELEIKRKQLEQKGIRSQLDYQLQEKERKNNDVKSEHQSYVNLERGQHERYLKHLDDTTKQKEKDKKAVFDMQTKMIDARNAQLDKEKKVQEDIDNKIKKSVEADLARQRELQKTRAETRKTEMEKIRSENDARKQRKVDQEEMERKEEIELQKLTNELAEDLERQRAVELKVKADKIQQMMVIGDTVIRDQRLKNEDEEKKLANFIQRKNRLLELKDKKMKEKEKENKVKYREILDLQIEERENKLKAEKGYIREQADLWKQETDYYNNFHEQKNATHKLKVDEYKKILQEQIKEKDQKAQKTRDNQKPNEDRLKELLLEQISNLEIQNKVLNEQLRD